MEHTQRHSNSNSSEISPTGIETPPKHLRYLTFWTQTTKLIRDLHPEIKCYTHFKYLKFLRKNAKKILDYHTPRGTEPVSVLWPHGLVHAVSKMSETPTMRQIPNNSVMSFMEIETTKRLRDFTLWTQTCTGSEISHCKAQIHIYPRDLTP